MEPATKRITTHTMVLMGVLSACSIILSRFLGFYLNETLRVSFGSVPIILAGIWLGPLAGGLVGAVADILGATVFSGLGLYLPITIGPILVGVASGIMARLWLSASVSFVRVAAVVLFAEVIGSLLWTSYALSLMTATPYWIVLSGRLPFCIVMDLLVILLVYPLHKRLGGRLQAKNLQVAANSIPIIPLAAPIAKEETVQTNGKARAGEGRP